MKVNLVVTEVERTLIVSALMAYEAVDLAQTLATVPTFDPAEDGPEVAILSVEPDANER